MTERPASEHSRFRATRIVEGKNVFTTNAYERPPSARPSGGSGEAIGQWLIGPARRIATPIEAFDEYAWRLVAAGLPLIRTTLHCGTLHPQFLGSAYVWRRASARTEEIRILHEVADQVPYAESPVAHVRFVNTRGHSLIKVLAAPG